MSDTRLRELERRWLASGEEEDEAAWLAALLQVGRVRPERLHLAAHLDHAAARRVLGVGDRVKPPFAEWFSSLQSLGGLTALRRAALAAAEAAVHLVPDGPRAGGLPSPRALTGTACEEARSFVACPCRRHQPRMPLWGPTAPPGLELCAAVIAIAYPPRCVDAARCALHLLREARHPAPEDHLRALLSRALLAWTAERPAPWDRALGADDPQDSPDLREEMDHLSVELRRRRDGALMPLDAWLEGGWRATAAAQGTESGP